MESQARVSLAHLLSTSVPLTADDAVALVVQLAQSPQTGRPTGARLSPDHVWLDADGNVYLSPGLLPTVREIGTLLEHLLATIKETQPAPLPRQLLFAVARASGQLEGGSFPSLTAFVEALAPFQPPDARAAIQAVFERDRARPAAAPIPAVVPVVQAAAARVPEPPPIPAAAPPPRVVAEAAPVPTRAVAPMPAAAPVSVTPATQAPARPADQAAARPAQAPVRPAAQAPVRPAAQAPVRPPLQVPVRPPAQVAVPAPAPAPAPVAASGTPVRVAVPVRPSAPPPSVRTVPTAAAVPPPTTVVRPPRRWGLAAAGTAAAAVLAALIGAGIARHEQSAGVAATAEAPPPPPVEVVPTPPTPVPDRAPAAAAAESPRPEEDTPPAVTADASPTPEKHGAQPLIEPASVHADGVFSPSFGANGTAIFFQAEADGASALKRADRGEGGELRIATIVDDGAKNYHVQLAPSGKAVAFDSDRDGVRGVYVAGADGKDVRRVSGPGYAAVPTWAPDGRRLAFIRGEGKGDAVWNLWVHDLDGAQEKKLTTFRYGQVWGAAWFPDGQRIAFSHEGTLTIRDLRTGRSKDYASPVKGRLVRTPAVSPDGRWIMFQVMRDGAWLLDVEKGHMQRVLEDPSAEEFTWAPDGRRVAFHSRRSGGWSLWTMAAP